MRIVDRLKPSTTFILFFTFILAIGIFARCWEYSSLPGGLHRDEASHAYDAYSVYHFGYDRNHVSYPLQFVTWGDGQTVLYPYLAVPFMAIFGLTPIAIRLPNLFAGILIIPLVFLVARQIRGTRFGLFAMFLMAISPWNIIGSRWGLEPYFLPFLFLLGIYFFLISDTNNFWFVVGMAVFGLCLYVYSTTFSAVPIFLALSIPILVQQKKISLPALAAGLLIFMALSIPNILYVWINVLGEPSIRIWRFTIPNLPLEARFSQQVALFHPGTLQTLLNNVTTMARMLWQQSDGWPRNEIEPYGYAYPLAPLLAMAGLVLVILSKKLAGRTTMALMAIWILSTFSIGTLQLTNLTRSAFGFIPIMLFAAYLLYWLAEKWTPALPIITIVYAALFIAFTIAYHSPTYKKYSAVEFHTGLVDSIKLAGNQTAGDICISPKAFRAYVFVLFTEQPDPFSVVNLRKNYVNPWRPFDPKGAFWRWKVLESQCNRELRNTYILRNDDKLPDFLGPYQKTDFGVYSVYIPE
jgi:hypothetical protein